MEKPEAHSPDAQLFAQLDKKFAHIQGMDALKYAEEHGKRYQEYMKFLDAEKDSIRQLVESQAKLVAAKPRPMVVPYAGAVANAAVATPNASITSEAFWWGFHVVIPEPCLNGIAGAKNVGDAIGGFLGAGASLAGVPPAAVLVLAIGAAYTLETALITAVDKGNGVYLSWSWVQVPALFLVPAAALPVPTPI